MVDDVGEEIIREARERRGQHGGKVEGRIDVGSTQLVFMLYLLRV